MTAKPIIVLGAGGNCRDIVDAMLDVNRHAGAQVFEPLGYFDDDPKKLGTKLGGFDVLGPISAVKQRPDCWFIDGLNGTDLTKRKKDILGALGLPRERWATVIHPSAAVSTMSQVGAGSVILHNVSVSSNARIGDHVMLLANSVVSHDGVIDDYCYLTPGVTLAGYVHLQEGVFMGVRSAVTPRVTIGARSVVGAGSVVLKDVPPDSVVAGSPARPLK